MSWVTEEKQKKEQYRVEQARREEALVRLSWTFFMELADNVKEDVEEINNTYPHIYNRRINDHLVFRGGETDSFEVMCSVSKPLSVTYHSNPPSLEVVRLMPKSGMGNSYYKTQNYTFARDNQGCLYLETKQGKDVTVIPTEQASHELLGFLTARL